MGSWISRKRVRFGQTVSEGRRLSSFDPCHSRGPPQKLAGMAGTTQGRHSVGAQYRAAPALPPQSVLVLE